jgi:hypothetical protein
MGTSPSERARQDTAASCKHSDLPSSVDLAPARETYVSQLLTQGGSAEKPLRGSPSTKNSAVYLDCPLAQRNQLPGYVTNAERANQMIDPTDQAKIVETLKRYAPLVPNADPTGSFPDREILWQLLQWQRLEIEVLEDHGEWLAKVKAAVERSGREWTHENFLRYCQLRECE